MALLRRGCANGRVCKIDGPLMMGASLVAADAVWSCHRLSNGLIIRCIVEKRADNKRVISFTYIPIIGLNEQEYHGWNFSMASSLFRLSINSEEIRLQEKGKGIRVVDVSFCQSGRALVRRRRPTRSTLKQRRGPKRCPSCRPSSRWSRNDRETVSQSPWRAWTSTFPSSDRSSRSPPCAGSWSQIDGNCLAKSSYEYLIEKTQQFYISTGTYNLESTFP